MSSGPQPIRRAKITVEAFVEITDEAAVIKAALAHLEDCEFTDDQERAVTLTPFAGHVGCGVSPHRLVAVEGPQT